MTAATELVAGTEDTGPSLVYIYGPSGVGKTRIVQNSLKRLLARESAFSTLYKPAAEFVDEFTEAAQLRSIRAFQLSFLDLDFLVVDDFHALENHPESQRQLMARIDELISTGGKVLIVSRKSPGELKGLQPRLANRCLGGVCCSVKMLSPASRTRLLTHFASSLQVPIPESAVTQLAAAMPVSPRELQAALVQLDAIAVHEKRQIDQKLVEAFLKREVLPTGLELAEIARATAKQFEISLKDMRSASRRQAVVVARQCAMYLARELTERSLDAIGEYFGNRDHATVVYACNRIKKIAPEQLDLSRRLTRIRQTLGIDDEGDC